MKHPKLAFLWRGVGSGDSCATLNGMDVGHMLKGATMDFNVGDLPEITLRLGGHVDVGVAVELLEKAGLRMVVVKPEPLPWWRRIL